MLEKYLQKVKFDSLDDFRTNFNIKVPDNFNFGYDVVDEWAKNAPHKLALLWTNDKGEEHRYTFADMKRMSDRVASFYLSLGIEKGATKSDDDAQAQDRILVFHYSIT